MNWRRRFDAPIALPDGRTVKTLRDALAYLQAIPATRRNDRWRSAEDVLNKAAEHGGPFVFIARISVAKAIFGPDKPPIGQQRQTKAETFKERRAAWKAEQARKAEADRAPPKRKKNPPPRKG